jgi:hypothetical protein
LFMVFLNSPCWETHKNTIKKISKINKIKPERYLPTWFIGHLPDIPPFHFFFPWTPLVSLGALESVCTKDYLNAAAITPVFVQRPLKAAHGALRREGLWAGA